MIYFLRAEQDTESLKAGWIKIGTTIRLSERIKQIAAKIGHTPTILAILNGSFAEERALHDRFSGCLAWREWFYPYDELLQLIADEGRDWDVADDEPVSNRTVGIRVYEDFADLARRSSVGRGMTTAEFCKQFLAPVLEEVHREFVFAEAKRLGIEVDGS